MNTATLTLTACTISGNSATNGGGGLFSYYGSSSSTISLIDTIVAGNTSQIGASDIAGTARGRGHWPL